MLRAEIGNDLRDLRVGQRVCKRRHFAATVENLLSDPLGCPTLVLTNVGDRGRLFGADSGYAVAMLASFIAKEDGSCLFIGSGSGGEERWRERYRE